MKHQYLWHLRWLAIGLVACATEPGLGYRTWQAQVNFSFDYGSGRLSEDSWLRLDNDYEIKLERASVGGGQIELLTNMSDSTGNDAVFDPANPPPGYSLCHNGHCHTTDGRLVDYEEIQAELAGGNSGQLHLLAAAILPAFDWQSGLTKTNLPCQPSCELTKAQITKVRLHLRELSFAGRVRDSRANPRFVGEQQWTYDHNALRLERSVQITISLDQPAQLVTLLAATLSPALWDSLTWIAASSNPLDLNQGALAETLTSRIASMEFHWLSNDNHD